MMKKSALILKVFLILSLTLTAGCKVDPAKQAQQRQEERGVIDRFRARLTKIDEAIAREVKEKSPLPVLTSEMLDAHPKNPKGSRTIPYIYYPLLREIVDQKLVSDEMTASWEDPLAEKKDKDWSFLTWFSFFDLNGRERMKILQSLKQAGMLMVFVPEESQLPMKVGEAGYEGGYFIGRLIAVDIDTGELIGQLPLSVSSSESVSVRQGGKRLASLLNQTVEGQIEKDFKKKFKETLNGVLPSRNQLLFF